MKYELIHDTIARQVFENASTEARTRRKVERFIREWYEANQLRGAKLTQDDIDYINPYLAQVNITAEEAAFVEKGRKALQAGRRRRMLMAGAIAVLLAFSVVSLSLWQRAEAQKTIAEEQTAFALEKEQEAEEKADSLELKEQALQISLQASQQAKDTAEVRRQEAEMAKIRADQQTTIAEREKRNAQEQAMEAKVTALAAKARQIESTDPTIALNLATAAYKTFVNSETAAAFLDISSNEKSAFYQHSFTGHSSSVNPVAFSPDGQSILTGSIDKTAKLWRNPLPSWDPRIYHLNEAERKQYGITVDY